MLDLFMTIWDLAPGITCLGVAAYAVFGFVRSEREHRKRMRAVDELQRTADRMIAAGRRGDFKAAEILQARFDELAEDIKERIKTAP